jgi:hypothetical protein
MFKIRSTKFVFYVYILCSLNPSSSFKPDFISTDLCSLLTSTTTLATPPAAATATPASATAAPVVAANARVGSNVKSAVAASSNCLQDQFRCDDGNETAAFGTAILLKIRAGSVPGPTQTKSPSPPWPVFWAKNKGLAPSPRSIVLHKHQGPQKAQAHIFSGPTRPY